MKNEEKASEIVIKIQNSSSLDYDGRRAKYMYDSAMEMAKWKDEQAKETVIDVWLCSIMSQDHTISNKDRQYIDLEVLKNILEDFFHIKLEEE